ncbi:MAG TPA: YciI family protein [Candidatus Competibacteraceae bacterium]|nr:YciI family protein [Candidatus Competibacteraceae bacterium]
MLYAIIGRDVPDSLQKRLAVREAHLARARALQAEGRLVLAGPFPAADCPDPLQVGFAGSLIVAEFDSLEAARAWAEADPYYLDGVYQSVEVLPFKQVLPA